MWPGDKERYTVWIYPELKRRKERRDEAGITLSSMGKCQLTGPQKTKPGMLVQLKEEKSLLKAYTSTLAHLCIKIFASLQTQPLMDTQVNQVVKPVLYHCCSFIACPRHLDQDGLPDQPSTSRWSIRSTTYTSLNQLETM